jgi:hypothetical protein
MPSCSCGLAEGIMKSKWTKTQSAVSSCNVSYNRNIDAETLVGVLSGNIHWLEWPSHIDTFFNELPETYIYGVLSENNLSLNQVLDVFTSLPKSLQGKNFKQVVDNFKGA